MKTDSIIKNHNVEIMPRTKGINKKLKKEFNEEQTNLLLESLKVFFMNNRDYLDEISDIINNKKVYKLANIEYLATTYSKKYKCCYDLPNGRLVYINDSYKNHLKSHTKRHFDPFKRFKKISFQYDNIELLTSVGQLNFLKWAKKYGVLTYLETNYDTINNEMIKTKEEKQAKKAASKAAKEAKEVANQ